MYATLTRQETRQNFSIWVYGDNQLKRGSGLHIGDVGLATNHHFVLPPDTSEFRFKEGSYLLEVHAKLLGSKRPLKLLSQELRVTKAEATSIASLAGLYFDWGPQTNSYTSHLDAPSSSGE